MRKVGARGQQRVLITAAAAGIGLEIALAFSSSGADVFITHINKQAIEAAKIEIAGLRATVCDKPALLVGSKPVF